MIECIFTIDYEIYGNGEGSLQELVYEPAQRLMVVFEEWDARFVNFVEVAELDDCFLKSDWRFAHVSTLADQVLSVKYLFTQVCGAYTRQATIARPLPAASE